MSGRTEVKMVRFLTLLLSGWLGGMTWSQEAAWRGPVEVAVSPDGRWCYVANADTAELQILDMAYDRTVKQVSLPARPTGMVLNRSGSRLYLTCDPAETTFLPHPPEIRVKNPVVVALEMPTGKILAQHEVGEGACSPRLSHSEKFLYLCARFDDCLEVVLLETGEIVRRVPVFREPVGVAETPDGKTLVVSHLLPLERTDENYLVASRVALVDTESWEVEEIWLPNGGINARGVCVSPDGKYAYIVHGMSSYMLTTGQVKGGWMNMNAISFIDLATRVRTGTLTLDHESFAAANPWGIACSADGKWLVVTHSGTADVSVIDRPAMHQQFENSLAPFPATGPTPDHMGDIIPAQKRIFTSGKGPRGVCIVAEEGGNVAYVANYFADTIDRIRLDENPFLERSIVLGKPPAETLERWGENLFHDAQLCFEQWQSCATCHPDARMDGLNWDLRNDGVGNPKNTKSMLYSHETPPSMAVGARPDAETAVRKGIEMILFTPPQEEQAVAIDAYLRALRPRRAPILRNTARQEAIARGKQLFYRAECDLCHQGEFYTDGRKHDVGTKTPLESRMMDTPTLLECWRTAPYLHDGRYTTLYELFRTGKHGKTDSLSDAEIRDLEAFLLSL
ncbi:MAG: hypothetical protein Q4E67_06800 [Planctomycetia bacterium]|nr:hypothetical protein [Planctomycetia bacterium]